MSQLNITFLPTLLCIVSYLLYIYLSYRLKRKAASDTEDEDLDSEPDQDVSEQPREEVKKLAKSKQTVTNSLIGEHNYTNLNTKIKLNNKRRRTPKERLLHTLSRLTEIAQALDEHQNVSKFSAALINAMMTARPLLSADKYKEVFCKTNPFATWKPNKAATKKKSIKKVQVLYYV